MSEISSCAYARPVFDTQHGEYPVLVALLLNI
jgi:hypothetical protein